ncbi:Yip1 family protein [Lysinibacillus parviboronicapiens]|uniref:Yip1 domain-containing protein n=1 Tax=Lysinibacillus parviboronicapiens TaxID=436516 RepID=A0ABV2PNK5_9BACI|nr:Yip1 family protein [Lysinibacillus parviboronicapiens]
MNNYHEHEQQTPRLNPFVSVWLHPKQTAAFMMEYKSLGFAFLLVSLGYIGAMFSGLIDSDIYPGMAIWLIALLGIVVSPLLGIIITAIYAGVLLLFGKLFQGTATYQGMFKSLSLTLIPSIALLPFYLIWLFTSPESLLISEFTGTMPIIFWVTILITIVTGIWSFVITIAVVAEAHQISNWKAFFTVFIPSVIMFILFLVLFVIIIFGLIGIGLFFDTP